MKDCKVNPIRVAHIINPTFGLVFNGTTHRIFSLLSGWNDEDIKLDLLGTQIKPSNMNSGEKSYILPSGVLWSSNLKARNRWDNIKWSLEQTWMLIKNRNSYDIVHFHALGWGSLLSPLFLHILRKKAVFMMSLYGNDNPSYLRQQNLGKLQLALLKKFDGAIGVSPALVNDAKIYGIKNLLYLPNFLAYPQLESEDFDQNYIEQRTATRERLGFSSEYKILFFIGAIIYRKGIDILIDSFIDLSKSHSNLRLVLAGPMCKEESTHIDEAFVKSLIDKLMIEKLEDKVHWLGLVKDQQDLVEYYRSSDIFVLPTRNEGLPNVLIEASAAKLPVVATLLPGITDEVVQDGVSGYLVEPERSDLFAEAIEKLLLDEDLRKTMGEAGRNVVLEKFGFDEYCKKLKNFYINF